MVSSSRSELFIFGSMDLSLYFKNSSLYLVVYTTEKLVIHKLLQKNK